MSGQQNNNTVNHVNDHEENHETLVHVEIEEEAPGYENVVLSNELSNTLHNGMVREEADRSQTTNGDLRLKDTVRTAVSVAKRTIILPHQKQILENFFNTGMTSASTQLAHLHEAACDQTGLDLHVVKNWVRNRRRPLSALRKQQEMQQEMQQPQLITLAVTSLPQTEGSSNNTSIVTIPPPPLTVPTPASIISSSTPIPSYIPMSSSSSPIPSYIPTCMSSSSHTPPPLYLPKPKRPNLEGTQQPNCSIVQDPLTVKARIADSDETDFVEVEVERMSYTSLLTNVCEELDVSISDVVKIRKLPNVLIRKDKDVFRMSEGQEIEVVLI